MRVQFALSPEDYSHVTNVGVNATKLPGVSSDRRKRETDRRGRRSRRRTIRKKEERGGGEKEGREEGNEGKKVGEGICSSRANYVNENGERIASVQ